MKISILLCLCFTVTAFSQEVWEDSSGVLYVSKDGSILYSSEDEYFKIFGEYIYQVSFNKPALNYRIYNYKSNTFASGQIDFQAKCNSKFVDFVPQGIGGYHLNALENELCVFIWGVREKGILTVSLTKNEISSYCITNDLPLLFDLMIYKNYCFIYDINFAYQLSMLNLENCKSEVLFNTKEVDNEVAIDLINDNLVLVWTDSLYIYDIEELSPISLENDFDFRTTSVELKSGSGYNKFDNKMVFCSHAKDNSLVSFHVLDTDKKHITEGFLTLKILEGYAGIFVWSISIDKNNTLNIYTLNSRSNDFYSSYNHHKYDIKKMELISEEYEVRNLNCFVIY